MNALWSYFWPVFAAGLVIGAAALWMGFRRDRRNLAMAVGLVMSVAAAGLWHGPLGGADRFAGGIDRTARRVLEYYEISDVTAHLARAPLRRELLLGGPADDFQRRELVRLLSQIPGVSTATWNGSSRRLPLIAEAIGAALAGFLAGLMLAYLVELRRRYNAQWKW